MRVSIVVGLLLCQFFCLVVACARPGRLYEVAPAITGIVAGGEASGWNLLLVVMHRDSPALFDRQQIVLATDGRFAFEATRLAIAGHEYSDLYRVFLHLQDQSSDRVVWRTELSRSALAGPIQLDCQLDRPPRFGQPCWVVDPLQHPWLIREGAAGFERLCARCHGADARGGASKSGDSKQIPADLSRIAARNGGRFDRERVAEWIEGRSVPAAHGSRTMPVWGDRLSEAFEKYPDGEDLIGATLDPVLAYLESIQEIE